MIGKLITKKQITKKDLEGVDLVVVAERQPSGYPFKEGKGETFDEHLYFIDNRKLDGDTPTSYVKNNVTRFNSIRLSFGRLLSEKVWAKQRQSLSYFTPNLQELVEAINRLLKDADNRGSKVKLYKNVPHDITVELPDTPHFDWDGATLKGRKVVIKKVKKSTDLNNKLSKAFRRML